MTQDSLYTCENINNPFYWWNGNKKGEDRNKIGWSATKNELAQQKRLERQEREAKMQ